MTRLWGSVFLDAGDTVAVDIDEESERHPYRVRLGTTNVHLDGETVRQLSAAIDAAIIAHDAKVWEPYYVDHDAQYAGIGRSHEPPFDVAKALDAEAARQEAEEAANPEPWNDRPWHWVSAAAVAPGDVVWLSHVAGDPEQFGSWVQVTNKLPDFTHVHWTLNDGSQATVRRTKSVRLADKVVHPDPCGGGDLPEPGRSFDVV